MEQTVKDFWQRVKTLIKASNTTQEGLAKSAGLNFSNLKQQIFYNRAPDALQAYRIAQALNTTVEYLVSGTESDQSRNQLHEIKKQLQTIADSIV